MVFVGEAVGTFSSDLPIGTELGARGDGQTVTLAAGALDDVLLGYGTYTTLLEDSAAVFQLVLLALSGSASIRVTYGTDPDYGGRRTQCTLTAGTFTVGTGETEVDLPGWTVPVYWNGDVQHLVRLEVLSGSVVLDQARLRIWPPGGYGGGWSSTVTPTSPTGPLPLDSWVRHEPLTAFTTDPPGSAPDRVLWPADDADRDDAFTTAQALALTDLEAADEAFPRFITTSTAFGDTVLSAGGGASVVRHHGEVGTNYAQGAVGSATAFQQRTYATLSTGASNPAGTQGVDWVRHPDRTPDDDSANAEIVGAPSWSWAQDTMTWQIQSASTVGGVAHPLTGGYYLTVRYIADPPATYYDGPDRRATWSPIATPGDLIAAVSGADVGDALIPTGGAEITLPPISGRVVELEASHDINFGFVDHVDEYGDPADLTTPRHDAGAGSIQFYGGTYTTFSPSTRTGYQPLSYYVLPAPYRYWSPTVAARVPLQWNQRTDKLGREGAPTWRGGPATPDGAQWRPRL